ncbi:sterol desaturase [Hesseltinella vesiculosa]|uniref:Sterol desaturase n=1 Tax=Hesseltinella vesiculosa TaxID=101127 RepID=A0A1X2GVA7_9FUNG|nr:sterol desaturase [Hesseltinella vesiculosa]
MYEGRNPLLVTGIFAFVMHELVYFGRFVPFFICDFIPYFQQYKLQQNKENTSEDYWKCTRHVLFQHFFYEGPLILFFHPMAAIFGMHVSAPFPTWQMMAIQLAVFFVYEDCYHYWMHRFMHWPPFYKRVHKVHHEYSAPFGIAAEYAHPIETMILGFGTVGGPLVYHTVVKYLLGWEDQWHLHLVTMLTWIVLRLFQAIDAHSGYDFPWSLHNIVPFWAGAEHHDYHHQAFIGNYSSSFRVWDYLFKTDVKYRAYRKRQKEERLKAKTQ